MLGIPMLQRSRDNYVSSDQGPGWLQRFAPVVVMWWIMPQVQPRHCCNRREWEWEGMGLGNGNGMGMGIPHGWTWEWERTIGNGRDWEQKCYFPAHLYRCTDVTVPMAGLITDRETAVTRENYRPSSEYRPTVTEHLLAIPVSLVEFCDSLRSEFSAYTQSSELLMWKYYGLCVGLYIRTPKIYFNVLTSLL